MRRSKWAAEVRPDSQEVELAPIVLLSRGDLPGAIGKTHRAYSTKRSGPCFRRPEALQFLQLSRGPADLACRSHVEKALRQQRM